MSVYAPKLFTVIMPVYNEEARVLNALSRLSSIRHSLLETYGLSLEVVVVDDGSTDSTARLLDELVEDIVLIRHDSNRGKGAAVRTGISVAKGEILAIQDADEEYDPRSFIPLLAPILEQRADVVYGSRYHGHSRLFSHDRWVHQALNALVFLFVQKWISDVETCQKLFRAEFLRNVTLYSRSFTIEVELSIKLLRNNARLTELPIPYRRRSLSEGKKIRIKDLFKAIGAIVTYGSYLDRLFLIRRNDSLA